MNTYIDTAKAEKIKDRILAAKISMINEREDALNNNYSMKIKEKVYEWRDTLIDIYAHSITNELDSSFSTLKKWGEETVNLLVNIGLPLDIAIDEIKAYRDKIGTIIKQEADQFDLSFDDFYDILSRFNSVVDRAIYWMSMSYSTQYHQKITALEMENVELTIPIIQVTKEIGILPLIGDIDTNRAKGLMDQALLKGNHLHLKHLIIDLSGVAIIDTLVADRIFKVIAALKLTGIKTIVTGIRPEIAATMVQLKINMGNTPTYSSLHLAMKHLQ